MGLHEAHDGVDRQGRPEPSLTAGSVEVGNMVSMRDYGTVTAAYWAFTLTDGALRMLVLLHFHQLGFTPFDIAILFLLYEAMGIVTNFLGGWVGSRFGLRITLFAGLAVQIAALMMLSFMDPTWVVAFSIGYVMMSQAMSGIAKDLTKMSSKSAVKLVVSASDQGGLFKWVAVLTGSKNVLKGVGFFLGGMLLQVAGFQFSLWAMAGMLAVVLAVAVLSVRADLGRAKTKIKTRELFSKTREINYLSAARISLFASRDVWFVVGVPIFLYETLGWQFSQVGAFMAIWVIGYGFIQVAAPKLVGTGSTLSAARSAKNWALVLLILPALIAIALAPNSPFPLPEQLDGFVLVGGLLVFGAVFAINSSLHSYLIVAYSDADKVAMNVGFYYMANAVGRFGGTFLSGYVYLMHGLTGVLYTSSVLIAFAVFFTVLLVQTGQSPYQHEKQDS